MIYLQCAILQTKHWQDICSKCLENVNVGRLTAQLTNIFTVHAYEVLYYKCHLEKLNYMHMEIIIQSNNGKICNNEEISAAVKIHAGGDEKQKINK